MPKLFQILETRNRKEQEKRVQGMKDMLETPVTCVTVFQYLGQVKFDVLGSQSIDTKQVKAILNQAVDELTRIEVEQERSQQAMQAPPTLEDDKRLEAELLEIPEDVGPATDNTHH